MDQYTRKERIVGCYQRNRKFRRSLESMQKRTMGSGVMPPWLRALVNFLEDKEDSVSSNYSNSHLPVTPAPVDLIPFTGLCEYPLTHDINID